MMDVKAMIALSGIVLAAASASSAGEAGCAEHAAGQPSARQASEVVVSVTRDAAGQIRVAVKGASTGVRVEAPPDVKIIAVGADGAAGAPGASGR